MSAADLDGMAGRASLLRRLWAYQAERFPLLKHGVAIAAFAIAGVALASLTEGGAADLDPWAAGVACVVSLLFFLQLRVADEHKDFEDDRRFRPERPVQRGLVTLKELRWIALGAAPVQAALAWSVDPALVVPLVLVWGWMAPMTAEFFAPAALKARPFLYMASHMVVTPLIALFAVACGWLGQDAPPSLPLPALAAFLALAFADGVVIEVARKAWAPADERLGVETYSKLWGVRPTAAAVAAAIVIGAALVFLLLRFEEASVWLGAGAGAVAAFGVGAASAYGLAPTTRRAKRLDQAASLWVLASYLLLGVAPLALQGLGA